MFQLSLPANLWFHDYGPTVISVFAYAVAGLAWWSGQRAARAANDTTLGALVKWSERHEEEAKQRDAGIAELRKLAASGEILANAQADQLRLIQQEMRDHRNRFIDLSAEVGDGGKRLKRT